MTRISMRTLHESAAIWLVWRAIHSHDGEWFYKVHGLFALILQSRALARGYAGRHFRTLMTLSITPVKCVIATQVSHPNNVQTSEMSS